MTETWLESVYSTHFQAELTVDYIHMDKYASTQSAVHYVLLHSRNTFANCVETCTLSVMISVCAKRGN